MIIIKLKQDAQVTLNTFKIETTKATEKILKKIGFWATSLANVEGLLASDITKLTALALEGLEKIKDSDDKKHVAQVIDNVNRHLHEYPNAIFTSEVTDSEGEDTGDSEDDEEIA